MKKSVLALALAFGVTTAFAQDLTSKKGEPMLPEAGDWGLAIDANPVLQYAKTFIGTSNGTNTINWNTFTPNLTITGKYFTDEKTAYRGSINLGMSSNKTTNLVDDDTFTGTGQTPQKEDTRKVATNGVWLGGGIEMRRGKTRLQGYYGGEIGIGFSGGKNTYTYGNSFSTSTTPALSPTSTDWTTMTESNVSSRVLTSKNGSTITFGLRGFIGAEYFFAAKMSIGGEFGFGLGFTSTGEGETSTEQVNSAFTGAETVTAKTGKSSSFTFGADQKNSVFGPTSSLRFNMYF